MNGEFTVSAIAWTAVVVCLVVVVVGFAVFAARTGKSARLKRRFGPEYDYLVETTGDRRQAEQALSTLVRSRRTMTVTPLSDDDRNRFRSRWADVQARFVDDPAGTVAEADQLVVEVMAARGYRSDDLAVTGDDGFDLRAGLIGYDHPETVAGYRSAHRTLIAPASEPGTSTEQLRTALVHYRTVFVLLVDDGGDHSAGHVEGDTAARRVSTA